MTVLFTPPVAYDRPSHYPVAPHRQPHPVDVSTNRFFSHFGGQPRGRTVLREGGVYSTVDTPDSNRVAAAEEVYLGGHVHTVSDAVGAALGRAGYLGANLLTANQQSVEAGTVGFIPSNNVSFARSTAQALDGSASLMMTPTLAQLADVLVWDGGDIDPLLFAGGRSLLAAASFRAATVASPVRLLVFWFVGVGIPASTPSTTGEAAVDTNIGWTEVVLTATAPVDAAYYLLVLQVVAPGAGEAHYVDRIGVWDVT